MALLPTAELDLIKRDLQAIVRDVTINTSIKYRQFTGATYNPRNQENTTSPYTDWSGVSAIKGVVTDNELSQATNIQIGDTKFVLMQSGVSNTLSTSDVVVESGSTFNVKQVKSDPLGIAYVVYCELG